MRAARPGLLLLSLDLGLPLLLVFLVEVGLRVYLIRAEMPPPRLFAAVVTSAKYLAFRQRAESGRPPDVLVMGSSPTLRIDARLLGERLAGAGVEGVFNFAGPLHAVELDRRILTDIVLPLGKPRVLVYGLNPLNLLSEQPAAQVDATVRSLPVFAVHRRSPAAWLEDFLLMHVRIVAYREVLRDAVDPSVAAQNDPWVERVRSIDEFGDVEIPSSEAPVRRLSYVDGRYKKQLRNFEQRMRTTPLFDNLLALAHTCAENGIDLVVLNQPVHPVFLWMLPAGQDDYDRFVGRLRELEAGAPLRFFDPAGGRPGAPELFQDTHHHNRKGGVWLTGALADYLSAQVLSARRPLDPSRQPAEHDVGERGQ